MNQQPQRAARQSSRAGELVLAMLIGLCATEARLTAQAAPVARSAASGFEVWSAPLSGAPASLVLEGASFQPLSLAGATFRDHLRRDLPVEAGAGSPAPHIRLPGGGSLFLLRQPAASVLLHVRADGTPTVAYSVAASGVEPSILGALAVSPDGRLALLATSPEAGGDLVLVDLPAPGNAAAPARLLTANMPPLALLPASLRVSSLRAYAIAGAGPGAQLFRVNVAVPAGQSAAIPLPLPADSTLLPETVLSTDGRSLALVGQIPGGLRHVVVVTPSGGAVRLTPQPAAVDAPALESPLGPLLAIAADGTSAAWRATVAGGKELFLQPVPAGPPPAPKQLTADAFFVDTLDNAGILGFAPTGLLGFGAGEAKPDGSLDDADLFVAGLDGGGDPIVQNVTQTGLVTTPFTGGALEIRAVMSDPLGQRLLFLVDPVGGDAALIAVPADGSAPGSLVLPPFVQDPVLSRAGDCVLLQSIPNTAPAGGTQLHLLRPQGSGVQLLGTLPDGLQLDRASDAGDASHFAGVVEAGPALQLPVRIAIASGAVLPVWSAPFQVSPLLAVAPSDALVAGIGNAGGPYLFVAFTGFQAGTVLKLPPGFGFPLPY